MSLMIYLMLTNPSPVLMVVLRSVVLLPPCFVGRARFDAAGQVLNTKDDWGVVQVGDKK